MSHVIVVVVVVTSTHHTTSINVDVVVVSILFKTNKRVRDSHHENGRIWFSQRITANSEFCVKWRQIGERQRFDELADEGVESRREVVFGNEDDDPRQIVVHGAAAVVHVAANRLGGLRGDGVVEVNEAREADSPRRAGRVEQRQGLLHEFLDRGVRGDFGEEENSHLEPLIAGTRLGLRVEPEGDVLAVDLELPLDSGFPLGGNRCSFHLCVDEERTRCASALPNLARGGSGEALVVGDVDGL